MREKKKYKMVRISEDTHARLVKEVLAISAKYAKNLYGQTATLTDRISVDHAICVLLDRKDDHAERSKRSQANRKKKNVDSVDTVDNEPSPTEQTEG